MAVKNNTAIGRLVYGFCGGLCLAILVLFIISLLNVEISQKGYSPGKGIFFSIWSASILSALFVKTRFLVARNTSLLFALLSFSIPIIYFFKTDSNVWLNATVLWVNISFFLLGACALIVFLWLARICRYEPAGR